MRCFKKEETHPCSKRLNDLINSRCKCFEKWD